MIRFMREASWKWAAWRTRGGRSTRPRPPTPSALTSGLAWIGRLYQIERQAREEIEAAIERWAKERSVAAAERALQEQRRAEEITLKLRQEDARPIVEKFATWLETMAREVLPKSPMGEAVG